MINAASQTTLTWADMLEAITALQDGDFAPQLPSQPPGTAEAAVVEAFNTLVLRLNVLTAELTRVIREVGIDSRMGGQAEQTALDGRWRELTNEVNTMSELLTIQLRQLATTTKALAKGSKGAPLTLANGEMRGVQVAVNKLVEQHDSTVPTSA
jgi:osomolarity two-component system sensor histidine kinase NIK1